jgi:hypothetical protein
MVPRYFFAKGDEQHGPYTAAEMRALAADGKIDPADLVWQEGVGHRFPASRVKGLYQTPVAEPPPVVDAAPQEAPPEEAPGEKPAETYSMPASEKPVPQPPKERPRRVVSIKGGNIVSQDGVRVSFRKKCEQCGYVDQGRITTPIRPGSMRVPFFCRKCRKGRTVEMLAIYG